jgi:predicted ATP-grasp superfamily ATP-dependent carboligase
MFKTKVLVCSGGTGSAFATAEAAFLNFKDCINLTICDINTKELVSSSVFADDFIVSKSIHDQGYKDFILNLVNSKNIEICIPFIDKDVLIFSELYSASKFSRAVKLHLNNPEIVRICSDKLLSYAWLKRNNISTPETFLLQNETPEPGFIIKPITGVGSIISDFNLAALKEITEFDKYLIQEKCYKPEVTIDVFSNSEYDLFFYVCRERIEIKSGVCTKARLFLDEELGHIAKELAEKLCLKFFCFQVMKLNGKWAVTDINPRLGSGTPMCNAVGIDFFSAMLADFLGRNPKKYLKNLEREIFVTRQYRNIANL